MKIIRLPYYRSEQILQDVIEQLGKRNIPTIGIGVHECRRFMILGDNDKRITTLSLLPEDVHLSVRTSISAQADEIVHVIWYKRDPFSLHLKEMDSWIFDARKNPEDKDLAAAIAANASFFFLWARDAFDLPWVHETWNQAFPEFVNTNNSLEQYLTWADMWEKNHESPRSSDSQAASRKSTEADATAS